MSGPPPPPVPLPAIIFLLLVAAASGRQAAAAVEIPCTSDFMRLDADSGYLLISRNQSSCGFLSKNSDQFFAIRTGDLQLKGGDQLTIHPTIEPKNERLFEPPFDDGYIVSGVKEPVITFTFAKQDATVMRVAFMQNSSTIPLSADINNDFTIDLFGVKSLSLAATKTVAQPIHLQLDGASFKDAGAHQRHKLITTDNATIPLDIVADTSVIVRTSPVLANCSSSTDDSAEAEHAILGPDPTLAKKPYKCVQLFQSHLQSPQAHYDVNLTSLVDLVDADDELIIDGADSHLKITRSVVSSYAGRVFSLEGAHLAVIYNSPRYVKPSQPRLNLTVAARSSGGVVSTAGKLVLPTAGAALFALEPAAKQFATIEIDPKVKQLKKCRLVVSSNGKQLANFSEGSYLPPVIGLSEPGASMDLEISGQDMSSLKDAISFKPANRSCHKIANSGSFSAQGPLGVCHWTISSTATFGLNIDYNDLGPKGCLTIRSLLQEKPIFDRCDLSKNLVLPVFVVKQALVSVTMASNSSRLDSSLSTSPFPLEAKLVAADRVNLTSTGYPVSYPWSSEKQVISLNGTKKNYVLSVADVDLRTGEKLLVNKLEVSNLNRVAIGDILLPNNSTTNITVVRQLATSDFGLRRGFNMSARSFDQIISVVASNSSRLVTPKNSTSLFIKLTYSTSVQDISAFASRINYNITLNETSKNYELIVYDSRSTLGRRIDAGQLQGATTSDTMLLVYQTTKSGAYLPELSLDFGPVGCNSSRNDFICDQNTRCVPAELMCHGKSYCADQSDLGVACTAGPSPAPKLVETGMGGFSVFILCLLMLTVGAAGAIYGPEIYEKRFRLGQYTTFTSTE